MRKTLLSLVALLICATSNAQVAKWMLNAEYDSITVNNVGLLEVRLDNKVGLYDRTGKELIPIEYDRIDQFHEGYALLYNGDRFVGFTDEQGKVVNLSSKGYLLREGADYFSCGRLLVYNQNAGTPIYRYINTDGGTSGDTYLLAHPYIENYAAVLRSLDNRDLTKVQYDMIDINGKPIEIYDDKRIGLQFISSFRDGKAILISKNKFYTITINDRFPSQIYTDDSMSRKSMVTLEYNTLQVSSYPTNRYLIKAKNGAFVFNANLQLDEYALDSNPIVTIPTAKVEPRVAPGSVFSILTNGSTFGLSYMGSELLPPQFEEITVIEDNFAVVRRNGKYGIITVDPTSNFEFDIDKGHTITFRHESVKVDLTATLPDYISQNAIVESVSSDCTIDKPSRVTIPNPEGLFIKYDCYLQIPLDLTENKTNHTYKFILKYDNLISTEYEVNVQEWYQKYYDVEITEYTAQFKENKEIKINFDIKKSDSNLDSKAYHKTVEVYQVMEDNSLVTLPCSEINDVRYSFMLPVTELMDANKPEENGETTDEVTGETTSETTGETTGEAKEVKRAEKQNDLSLNFEIHITEDNCPTIKCPFVVNLEIPEPPKEGEPVVDTPVNVTVQAEKRPTAASTPAPEPTPAPAPAKPRQNTTQNTTQNPPKVGLETGNKFEIINQVQSSNSK